MNLAADASLDLARVEAETRAWVRRAVVGLGLCPFAGAAETRGLVRYVVSAARDLDALLDDLVVEIRRIADADPETLETTLLVHPYVLNDFDDYNDFLDVADAALDELDLTGELQVASFHPAYRFADTDDDDVTNASNRSPYPLLQLLREASIERAVDAGLDTEAVIAANLETLERLGHAGWEVLRAACRRDAGLALGGVGGEAGHAAPGAAPVGAARPNEVVAGQALAASDAGRGPLRDDLVASRPAREPDSAAPAPASKANDA